MNDFVRESINQGSSGGGSSGGSGQSSMGGSSSGLEGGTPTNNPTPDPPPPPRPENPKEFERDESDPLTDSPGMTGANKKKKKRKGKRDLRRGGFLSALKIDRGSSLGKGGKDNPYTLGGV